MDIMFIKVTHTRYNTDDMAVEFLMEFQTNAFIVGQPYVFKFQDKPLTRVIKYSAFSYGFLEYFLPRLDKRKIFAMFLLPKGR